MPPEEYETRTDSVLAWKKAQKLGRFDPDAPSIEQQKVHAIEREISERGECSRPHVAVYRSTHVQTVSPSVVQNSCSPQQ